jgi:hypothetical protein
MILRVSGTNDLSRTSTGPNRQGNITAKRVKDWCAKHARRACLLIEVNRPSVLPRVNSRKWTHNRLRAGLHSWPLKSSGAMDLA